MSEWYGIASDPGWRLLSRMKERMMKGGKDRSKRRGKPLLKYRRRIF